MKKQNILVQVFLVGLILCMALTFFYTRGYSVEKNRTLEKDRAAYGNVAEKLLNKRMVVINNFIYGTIGYTEAIKQLKTFEKGPCLMWDLEFVKDLKDHPTAYARVEGFVIQDIQAIERDNNRMTLTLNIEWSIEDFETNTTEKGIYKVVIEESEGMGYKLLEFDPVS